MSPNVHCRNAFHKESKICIPQEHAFDIPSYVLKYTMNGQIWPHGDDVYYEGIDVFTLLIHGRDDHLVSVEEEQDMVEVRIDDIYMSHTELLTLVTEADSRHFNDLRLVLT